MSGRDLDQDVIVVGGGGAGMAAAIEARSAGASVLVIEAAERVGGATAMSGGVVMAGDTAVQRAAGVCDSLDEFYAYYMGVTRYVLEPRLVRTLVEGAQSLIPWLESHGVRFDPQRLYVSGLETLPRGHQPEGPPSDLGPGGGGVLASALLRRCWDLGAEFCTGTEVTDLVRDSSGTVVGVRTERNEEYRAGTVVLATGGFGNNPALLARLFPDAARHGEWHWYVGPPTNQGGGLIMATDLGAAVVGNLRGQLIQTPNFARVVDVFFPPWLVLVNLAGQRFINEMASYTVLPDSIARQEDGRVFALFDEATLAEAIDDPSFVDPYGFGADFHSNWTKANLQEQMAIGRVIQASSIEELGARTGIDAKALAVTVDEWNSSVANGRDTVFEKSPAMLLPIRRAPFYAVEVRAAVVGATFSGLRIDPHARVLDNSGDQIRHLFAAGEVAGGLMGTMYPGGGALLANAMAYGRIAGRNAARTALSV